jgi:ribonuclease P protein component
VTPAFVLEGKARTRAPTGQPSVGHGARFGFTVTRKLGGAVERNRMRRRLKEAVRLLQHEHAADEFDYVLMARSPALDRQFSELISDLVTAFRRVNRPKSGGITR